VFEDNFDGTTLDTTVWYNTQPWGQYHPDTLPVIFLPENVSVHDDYLWLILKEDGNRHYVPNLKDSFRYPYSAGMVWSKKHFKYGIFEARIKIPNKKNLWCAFWF
jgi:beta-glucanase (GH16 family)